MKVTNKTIAFKDAVKKRMPLNRHTAKLFYGFDYDKIIKSWIDIESGDLHLVLKK